MGAEKPKSCRVFIAYPDNFDAMTPEKQDAALDAMAEAMQAALLPQVEKGGS